MTIAPLYLRLYPVFLGCSALGGLSLCQWYFAIDLQNRRVNHDISLQYLLTTVPQLLAALLLLYYACTFSRTSSALVHRMLVVSCLHQSITGLTLISLIISAFNLSLGVCCSIPVLCPIDQTRRQLTQIVTCSESMAQSSDFNLYPRLVHSCATFIMLLALASIEPAHTIKDMNSRIHHAKLITFSRREPVHEASPSVF